MWIVGWAGKKGKDVTINVNVLKGRTSSNLLLLHKMGKWAIAVYLSSS